MTYYSLAELLAMRLPDWPSDALALAQFAEQARWPYRDTEAGRVYNPGVLSVHEERHGLTLLGQQVRAEAVYNPALLEGFANAHPDRDYWVTFICPEFTSLCPITSQPDFATIYISYIPDQRIVESKSLKLYLFGFRNHGGFHEHCTNIIMNDLIACVDPRYIEVYGAFSARGGIAIHPYVNYGRAQTPFADMAHQRLYNHHPRLKTGSP